MLTCFHSYMPLKSIENIMIIRDAIWKSILTRKSTIGYDFHEALERLRDLYSFSFVYYICHDPMHFLTSKESRNRWERKCRNIETLRNLKNKCDYIFLIYQKLSYYHRGVFMYYYDISEYDSTYPHRQLKLITSQLKPLISKYKVWKKIRLHVHNKKFNAFIIRVYTKMKIRCRENWIWILKRWSCSLWSKIACLNFVRERNNGLSSSFNLNSLYI